MGKLANILTYNETHVSMKIAYIKELFENVAIDNVSNDGDLRRILKAISEL